MMSFDTCGSTDHYLILANILISCGLGLLGLDFRKLHISSICVFLSYAFSELLSNASFLFFFFFLLTLGIQKIPKEVASPREILKHGRVGLQLGKENFSRTDYDTTPDGRIFKHGWKKFLIKNKTQGWHGCTNYFQDHHQQGSGVDSSPPRLLRDL